MKHKDFERNIENANKAFTAGSVPTQEDFAGLISAVRSGGFFAGFIAMYSGSANGIPSDWAICDGTQGTPNLVGRFIVGGELAPHTEQDHYPRDLTTQRAGPVGLDQPKIIATVDGSTEETALEEAHLPAHRHAENLDWMTFLNGNPAKINARRFDQPALQTSVAWADSDSFAKLEFIDRHHFESGSTPTTVHRAQPSTAAAGGNVGHSHKLRSLTLTPQTTLTVSPPYWALAFIMKL